jgi:hypothetical protein
MRIRNSLVLVLATAASCHYASPDLTYVPDNPTYQRDVYPLMSDHCLLCHSSPPNRGAPESFRLDVYEDTGDVLGAQSYFAPLDGSNDSSKSIPVNDIVSKRMPPEAKNGEGVGPNGIEMLRRWIANGLPKQ